MSSYQSDILATGLKAVFCGINPAESAERAGHNFSTPSNRFWNVLYLSRFTAERLRPQDERRLLDYNCGVTAVVRRSTRRASEVSPQEFRRAQPEFEERMRRRRSQRSEDRTDWDPTPTRQLERVRPSKRW